MAKPKTRAELPENRLLRALPQKDYERLAAKLERVTLGFKQVVYEPNAPIGHVYFPLSGVISLLTVMDEGGPVEVATVGREGMVGLPVFLGDGEVPGRAFAQIAGDALRMEADDFRAEARHPGPLQRLLLRYTQALLTQVAQSAACNRLHSVEERCARWLLQTQDRVRADQFPLTQEFMAQMLGVRRATVNVAAGILQKAGFITYTRGRITILDRPGLESASCECYAIIKADSTRLLGPE
jgi:CRP-like cAMP-binding protein